MDTTNADTMELMGLEEEHTLNSPPTKKMTVSVATRRIAAVAAVLGLVAFAGFQGVPHPSPLSMATTDTESLWDSGISVCHHGHHHECPAFWGPGGYLCRTHGGCRHENQGPFPRGSCSSQCRMIPHYAHYSR